jgi:Secretion system C-terminal sorting domain
MQGQFFLLCCSFWLPNIAAAQDLTLMGYPGSDVFTALVMSEDDGFVIAGSSKTNGSDDISLHFFQSNGQIHHCHYYGKEKQDLGLALARAKNGDYLLAGQGIEDTLSNSPKAIVYRIDAVGQIIWKKSFFARTIYAIREMKNGQIALGGFSANDNWVALLNASGHLLWAKQCGTIYEDYAFGLLDTDDNGLLIGSIKNGFHALEGHDYSMPDSDIRLVKFNAAGDSLWHKDFGGAGHDFISQMEMDQNGHIYIAGSTQGDGKQSFDAFVLKIDQEANIIWQRQIGGTDFEYGLGLSIADNGDVLLCGTTNSNTVNDRPDMFVARFDKAGNELWYQQPGNSGSEYAEAIAVNSRGEIIVSGYSVQDEDKQYLLAKWSAEGEMQSIQPTNPNHQLLFISPNPTTEIALMSVATHTFCGAFTYELYSMEGKRIESAVGYGSVLLDCSQLQSGMYVVKVLLEDGTKLTEKLMVK